MNICVLGAGTWGIALSALLSKNGHAVTVWSAIENEIAELSERGVHKNLPDVILPKELNYTVDIASAISGCEMLLFAVPSEFIRQTARRAAPYLTDGIIIVNASKGIERGTLFTLTEVIADEARKENPDIAFDIVALSGPTHAEDVAHGLPSSIVSACENEDVSRRVAAAFANTCMRVYTNTDVLGVEISGALKNIIAIAAGINRGMGFGDNAGAMLMTRGIAEITRLGLKMGCRRRTFMGLAGIGDLIVTCTSRHSRNNRCGELIGKGLSYEEALSEIGMVVEGYHALEAAMELSRKYETEMPITEAVYDTIKNGIAPLDAMKRLMTRDLKSELDE